MDAQSLICPTCGSILAPDDMFCSHCGAQVVKKVATIGLGKQIYIYFVSLFLPPFGLVWTWKFFRTGNAQMKRVGWIALILTIVSTIFTIWITIGFFQGLQSQINSVSSYSGL